MFVVKQSDSYLWPVEVKLPDNGEFKTHTFKVEFKRVTRTRLAEIIAMAPAETLSAIAECIIGWKEVVGEDKKEIQFSASALDSLLDNPHVAGAIAGAFFSSFDAEKRKNS